ncbi:MAG: ABC transporter ATP-binding protein [Acidimicrobiales bacterium]
MILLEMKDVSIDYSTDHGMLRAVDHVSLSIHRGESVGIAGESGCGKTTLGLAVPLLLAPNASVATGSITLDGTSLVGLSEKQMDPLRWSKVAFVFQGAMNALNPVQRIDHQILEAITTHEPDIDAGVARERVRALLDSVGIAPTRASSYPHEFSGGMRQRVMIAMSLACRPMLLIADEPTTALDVISQAQILALLRKLRRSEDLSLILISHDLAAIKRVCDRVVVMYAGVVVESGSTASIFGTGANPASAAHPYTQALIAAHPDLHGERVLAEGLSGHPPDLSQTMVGCRFADRCPYVMEVCRRVEPTLVTIAPGHIAACHLVSGVTS